MKSELQTLASKIDHTLLKPGTTAAEIENLCKEAMQYNFATVCIPSHFLELATSILKNSSVKPITVVGFPKGTDSTESKVKETQAAIHRGAKEIDMVVQIEALKGRNLGFVFDDIRQVVLAASPLPVKVILETAHLTDDEKIIGCSLSKAAGAAFVKTSTGFGSGGATVQDISLMRRAVGSDMGVKASGGIRNYHDAIKMIEAGATRLGTSASVAIVTQTQDQGTKTGY